MKKFIAILSIVAGMSGCMATYAEIPQNYYTRLNGKSGAELKQAAFEIINPHNLISSYQNLPQYFQKTDVYPMSREWWDMYSNVQRYIPSFSGLNREHSLPKSWWGGSTDVPAYIDLNHLYPADGPANQAKSNYPLGEVSRTSNIKFQNGVSTVGYPVSGQGGGAQYVYEPADEYKGDFARTYFYMATCYQNLTWKYTWMLQQNDYPTLSTWAVNLLLKWHREDPVSQKETDRNDVVYGFQNNRNPFIDFPDLAEYIWGNKVGETFNIGNLPTPGKDPVLITPTPDITLDFGQVATGNPITALLYFKGENLTKSLSLLIDRNYSESSGMFTIPGRTITAQNVNNGYYLQVTYTPTSLGEHSGRILIYDGGLEGTGTYAYLRGECLEVPTLSALTAYPASDITSDTYTATWSEAPEVIDYYVVTRTRYIGGNQQVEEIECDENLLEVSDFDSSDSESYMVQSSRLGYRSDPSNVVFVSHSGINDIRDNQPLTAASYPSIIRLSCSSDHTNGRVYDASGRLVMLITTITDGLELTLPAGTYLLTTAEHPSPIKLIAR